MIKRDFVDVLIGRDSREIGEISKLLELHVHYVGRGGVAAFAVSAVDIALWDIRGKDRDLPLWKLLGGTSNTTKAYCGGIDLNFPIEMPKCF